MGLYPQCHLPRSQGSRLGQVAERDLGATSCCCCAAPPATCQQKPPGQCLCRSAWEGEPLSPASCCCRAEGRALQAVKDPACPHRVANHNFGAWESWEVTSSGLVNLQWRHKVGQPDQAAGLQGSCQIQGCFLAKRYLKRASTMKASAALPMATIAQQYSSTHQVRHMA